MRNAGGAAIGSILGFLAVLLCSLNWVMNKAFLLRRTQRSRTQRSQNFSLFFLTVLRADFGALSANYTAVALRTGAFTSGYR
jgi:hypothetical protein